MSFVHLGCNAHVIGGLRWRALCLPVRGGAEEHTNSKHLRYVVQLSPRHLSQTTLCVSENLDFLCEIICCLLEQSCPFYQYVYINKRYI